VAQTTSSTLAYNKAADTPERQRARVARSGGVLYGYPREWRTRQFSGVLSDWSVSNRGG
jgi:hypothetical protein